MKSNAYIPLTAKILSLSALIFPIAGFADSSDYFEPPMVSIPAGSYFMGSDKGAPDEQPVRKVEIPAISLYFVKRAVNQTKT